MNNEDCGACGGAGDGCRACGGTGYYEEEIDWGRQCDEAYDNMRDE